MRDWLYLTVHPPALWRWPGFLWGVVLGAVLGAAVGGLVGGRG